MHGAERQRLAADLLHQGRHGRAQVFEKRAQLLPPKQFRSVAARDFR